MSQQAEQYANSEFERLGQAVDSNSYFTNRHVHLLIRRAWEQGFGAARASKTALEEVLDASL